MRVEIPIPERTLFPGHLFDQKVDITGDGKADGVYLSKISFQQFLEWEVENRREWADFVAIVEAEN